ncbi:MAG TPA: SCO2523 family variant P-loop protein [Micromonosporaceae bacterium]|nr:SCO2523 family variant P-loop protein [Micromonosporaceae bacterium]
MLVFATSDKGGTGRSVTSCNVVYRRAIQGSDVAYLDFDFGSPTAGAIFAIASVEHGTAKGGLHAYLNGDVDEPHRLDVWSTTDRSGLRGRPDGAGQLCLFPGDKGGGEFGTRPEMVDRCVRLLLRMEEEFHIALVDLSAGRSHATEIALAAMARPQLRGVVARWLVFHRWTQQHIIAAAGLVHGEHGLLASGARLGHEPAALASSIRFVRTAVVDPNSEELAGLRPAQVAWLRERNRDLQALASARRVGRVSMLGAIPLDPVLQWQEQLISDADTITRQIANRATADAFETIAKALTDDSAWVGL